MGLSVIADMPDMDQMMKYANSAGSMAYMTPGQWVGEQNLNGLGLADSDVASGINSGVTAFQQIYGTIEAAKLAKAAAKNQAKGQQTHPMAAAAQQTAPQQHQSSGGESDLGKWLLIGGVAVAGIIVLMMVMKKKNGGGDHKGD